jgi:hypothetical protein
MLVRVALLCRTPWLSTPTSTRHTAKALLSDPRGPFALDALLGSPHSDTPICPGVRPREDCSRRACGNLTGPRIIRGLPRLLFSGQFQRLGLKCVGEFVSISGCPGDYIHLGCDFAHPSDTDQAAAHEICVVQKAFRDGQLCDINFKIGPKQTANYFVNQNVTTAKRSRRST